MFGTQATTTFGATGAGGFRFPSTTPATSAPPFGAPASTSAVGLGFNFTNPVQAASTSVSTQGTGLFGPVASVQTAAPAAFPSISTTGLGQAVTTTPSSFLAATATTSGGFVGLGGTEATLATGAITGATTSGASGGVAKPKDTDVPAEIRAILEGLKNEIKISREISDVIASSNMTQYATVSDDIEVCSRSLSHCAIQLPRLAQQASSLKDSVRQDIRHSEQVQKLQEGPIGAAQQPALHIQYLNDVAAESETQLIDCQRQVETLERLLVSRQEGKAVQWSDVIDHLAKMKDSFEIIAALVYNNHEHVKTAKEKFLRWQQHSTGRTINPFIAASALPDLEAAHARARAHFDSIEGPSPFAMGSSGSVVALASAVNRTLPGAGLSTGLIPTQQIGSTGFTTQPMSFGTTTAFRPSVPVANSSLFGTPAMAPTTTTTPLRFGTSFNTSSSGTLFSGSASVAPLRTLGK